jgi:hypothetical protein
MLLNHIGLQKKEQNRESKQTKERGMRVDSCLAIARLVGRSEQRLAQCERQIFRVCAAFALTAQNFSRKRHQIPKHIVVNLQTKKESTNNKAQQTGSTSGRASTICLQNECGAFGSIA